MKRNKVTLGAISLLVGALPLAALSPSTSAAASVPSGTPQWSTYPTPPAGFNPLTATSEQLAKYGFPAKPTNASDLASWTNAMEKWTASVPQTNPALLPKLPFGTHLPTAVPGMPKPKTVSDTVQQSTPSWSGYLDYNTTGYGFTDAHSQWAANAINSGSQAGSAYGAWVGFGGDNEAPFGNSHTNLMQTGYNAMLNSNGTTTISPFFQIIPLDFFAQPVNLSIASGQGVYTDIEYSTVAGGTFYYYMENLATGQSASGNVSSVSSYYDGTQAEVIAEDPGNPSTGTNYPLGNFGTLSFSNSNNSTSQSAYGFFDPNAPYTIYAITAYNPATADVLATPNPPSSNTNFQDLWESSN